ncbi:MAG: DNA-deoxyinosine glycosylase [Bacteroidota bacterium]
MEYHPFEPFVSEVSSVLILGSFPGKESTQQLRKDDWFYNSKRNQFWKILEMVYKQELSTSAAKKILFTNNRIAVTDIIVSCERRDNSNSDQNLTNKEYNWQCISSILAGNAISRILFTSKSVYREFIHHFDFPKDIRLIVLPSPSPRYARLSLVQKSEIYKKYMPSY